MPVPPRRVALTALIAAVGVLIALVAAWAIDRAAHSGQVMRNTEVGGVAVGGLSGSELRDAVVGLGQREADRPVVVVTPAGTLTADAAALGLSVDVAATEDRAMEAGRDGSALTAPFTWLGSLLTTRQVDPVYTTEPGTTAAAMGELVQANLTPPVEPAITLVDDRLTATPGQDGQGLDLDDLRRRLVAAALAGDGPITVDLSVGPVAPLAADAEAERVAAEANQVADRPLTVQAGGRSAVVEPATVRTWLRAAPVGDGSRLELSTDVAAVDATLVEVVGQVGTPPTQLTWHVGDGGAVSYTPGTPGTTCCAPDSAARIVAALQAGQPTVALELGPAPPAHDAAWAESMQITQPVASFTTPHACCEARVQNIQRIADLVRGVVIEPGQTFSVNGYVGQRTTAKGFVPAGVIYAGVFTEDVGGGVSQFATTLFNAAFFAGLEIPEYMAHTIYISRYPYGREATLSYTKPDLKITNNTPYGILIWPTYTGTSVTVDLYSTPWITAEQTGQTTSPSGACTRVTTERTRTWLADGRQEKDTVGALYQPAEGVLC